MDGNPKDSSKNERRTPRTDRLRALFDEASRNAQTEGKEAEGGISVLEIGNLPADERTIMNALIRLSDANGSSLSDLQREVNTVNNLPNVLDRLVGKDYVIKIEAAGESRYKPKLKRMHGNKPASWSKLFGDE